MPGYVAQVRTVFGSLRSNADLRRVQLAFAGYNAIEQAVWIAMLVYAYENGGAAEAGMVALVQLAPSVFFGPYVGALGDRHPRALVLIAGYLGQALAMAATAVALAVGGPPVVAYACATAVTLGITVTRPIQAALLPDLARHPDEVTAMNVISGWVEGTMWLVSPALAGVLLAVSGPGAVFALCAAVAAVAAAVVLPLARRARAERPSHPVMALSHGRSATLDGIRVLREEPAARLLVGLLGAQFVAIGALDVLYVVLAVTTLELGDAWAGYLNAAFGAGGALGVAITVLLVGRAKLMPPLVAGIAFWGVALLVLAAAPTPASALLCLVAAGVARMVIDVTGRTLLQRAAPPEVLARVFGVLEGLQNVALAAGSLLVPVLVALGGASAALVGVSAVLPLVAAAAFRGLRTIDRRARVPVAELALLRSMPVFAGLSAPVLEGVARSLVPRSVAAGEVLIREGERGDRYYAIAGGTLTVSCEGRELRTVGRGDGVGEIALLRDVPRTATVVASEAAHVYSLEKAPFLAAVTGHAPVERVVEERLAANPTPTGAA